METKARKAKRTERRDRVRPDEETYGGLRIERRNVILFVIAVATIGLGFVSLALGSTSISAILLVGGYLGLVPWAILAGRGIRSEEAVGTDSAGVDS